MLRDFLPSYADDHRLLALVLYPLKIPAIPDQEANHSLITDLTIPAITDPYLRFRPTL